MHFEELAASTYPDGLNHFGVAAHIYQRVFDSLVGDASGFFVFISGFLFYEIFYKRGFRYGPFMKGKLKKVFCPYIIAVMLVVVSRQIFQPKPFSIDFLDSCLFFGSFWYVPFIMCMFLCAPLHFEFIEMRRRPQLAVLVVATIFSMMIGRNNLNPVFSAFFWNAHYLFGIWCAMTYKDVLQLTENQKHCLLIMSALMISALMGVGGEALRNASGASRGHLAFFDFYEIAVNLKVIACYIWSVSFLIVLRDLVGLPHNWLRRALDVLAKYSFSIFFYHNFLLAYWPHAFFVPFLGTLNFWELQLWAFAFTCATCLCIAGVGMVVRKVAGKYSRMLIGS